MTKPRRKQVEDAMPLLGRRTVLVGAGALVTVWVGRAVAARQDFQVVEQELVVAGLDPRHDGLVVAQVSDVHLGLSTPQRRVERAVETLNALRPDVVVLTGDYVSFSKKPVARVGPALAGLKAPTFAVLGNHDHWVDAERVRAELVGDGYAVLQNESRSLQVKGAPLTLVGIDDEQVGRADVARAFAGVGKTGSRLVLAHQPKTADQLPRDAGLVCFSGHTHGGQIVVPKVTEAIAHQVGQHYLKGVYRVRGNWLVVSAGLGYGRGGPAVRLRVPPEISLVTLRAG
ncbi:MAG TPA: metallophosphoesterase [Myxococcales bacterium]|jgi:hypothetical protein